MYMGFILHIYIIFGTNLLTGGLARIAVFFCLFQYFEEKEYQTESKRNETFGSVIFGTNVIQRTWSASQAINEEATRQGDAPAPLGVPPPSWAPCSSSGPTLLVWGLLLVHKKSSKIVTSIGLRLVFLFCKIQKQGKNRNWHWALG